jgi:hypothetical protein
MADAGAFMFSKTDPIEWNWNLTFKIKYKIFKWI